MNLIEQLLKQLSLTGRESAEVHALMGAIRTQQPDQEATAQAIIDHWSQKPRSKLPSLTRAQMGVVGGGVGILAILPFIQNLLHWAQANIPLPFVKSPIFLLLIVAAIGGLAGAIYSIYCNRAIVFPTMEAKSDRLTLDRLGILNEIGFGALAAVTTVWLAAVGLAPPIDTVTGAPQAQAAPTPAPVPVVAVASVSLLTWSVIIGATTSGWFGARMRSSHLNQSLLQEALAQNVTKPAGSDALAKMVRDAEHPAQAARLATGKEVLGASATAQSVPPPPQ
jgi:hypothetical protein